MKAAAKQQSRFAQRATSAFSDAMLAALGRKDFKNITVNEICQACNYPRSTFYNYFDDLFGLMDYCWERIGTELEFESFLDIPVEQRTAVLFEKAYNYMSARSEDIARIVRHNGADGLMVQSANRFIREKIKSFLMACSQARYNVVGLDILAEHYSNTIQMLLSRCFLQEDRMTKQEAMTALEYLIGTLEREEFSKCLTEKRT